jgi:hypothetical protein
VPLLHRSRVLRPLVLVAAAAVVVPLCGVPAASAADQETSVVGRLVQAWPEYRNLSDAGSSGGPLSWIAPEHGHAVRVPTGELTNLPRGATVQVALGEQVDDGAPAGLEPAHHVVAARVVAPAPAVPQPAAAVSPAASAAPATNQVTVVMAVPAAGARDGTALADVVAAVNGPVAQFWSAQSGTAVRIQVAGQVDWPAQPFTASCATPTALLDEAQAASGFVPGPGKHLLVYLPPSPGCADGFAEAGSGAGSGGRMYVTGVGASLIAHEFGHGFGLREASALQCDQAIETGRCHVVPGGDRYDVMGNPWQEMGALSPMEAAALGFLDPGRYDVQTNAVGSAEHSLMPYGNLNYYGRALRLVAPDGSAYWVEYRTALGQDAWLGDPARNLGHLDSGVLIRRETRPGDRTYAADASLLLDATPSPAAGWDGDQQQAFPVAAPVRIDGGTFTLSHLARRDSSTNIVLRVEVVGGQRDCASAGMRAPMSGVSLLDAGGTIRAFVVGSDRALWTRPVDGSPGGWQSLGGGGLYGPASVSAGSTAYAFVVGLNGALFYRADSGSGWGPWTTLGGVLTASPAAASLGDGHVRVFGRGTDGQLWTRELRNGSWSPWVGLGGYLTASPTATADIRIGRIVVEVRGQDGYNWEQALSPGSGPVPYQWVGVATCSSFAMSAVRAGDDPTHGAYLGWAGLTTVYTRGYSSHLSGTFTSNPAVSFFSDGNLLVAGRGLDGALWVFDTRTPGGPFLWNHTWTSLGGYILD